MINKNILIACAVLVLAVVVVMGLRAEKPVDQTPISGKLDINVVCEGALSYMTFPDAQSAETFVNECKEGKHPEVIERYKEQMGLGDGATI
jgi:hypothetical protein